MATSCDVEAEAGVKAELESFLIERLRAKDNSAREALMALTDGRALARASRST